MEKKVDSLEGTLDNGVLTLIGVDSRLIKEMRAEGVRYPREKATTETQYAHQLGPYEFMPIVCKQDGDLTIYRDRGSEEVVEKIPLVGLEKHWAMLWRQPLFKEEKKKEDLPLEEVDRDMNVTSFEIVEKVEGGKKVYYVKYD